MHTWWSIWSSNYKKVKPLYRPRWPMGPVLNSGFLSMKQLGVLLLPPGWDASPSQGYPQHICWYPFVHLGEEKHCESKVFCLRTQHNDPGQGSNLNNLIQKARINTTAMEWYLIMIHSFIIPVQHIIFDLKFFI